MSFSDRLVSSINPKTYFRGGCTILETKIKLIAVGLVKNNKKLIRTIFKVEFSEIV